MRQIAGSFAEYEKRRLVRKLREARERSGKLGGRKSYAETRPDTVSLAKELNASGLSYRKISSELAARGHLTGRGKPHVASAVQKMLIGRRGKISVSASTHLWLGYCLSCSFAHFPE